MAVVEAQVRPELAKEYSGLTPGWYLVNQSARERPDREVTGRTGAGGQALTGVEIEA
jgi:hypothetical protein